MAIKISMPFHVCLIDDDPDAAFFVRRAMLKVAPEADFTYYQNSQQALEELSAGLSEPAGRAPDLILLDLNMPYLTGWEFLAEACGVDGERKPPGVHICILTSSGNPDDLNRARAHRCVSCYIEKHITSAKLRETLAQFD